MSAPAIASQPLVTLPSDQDASGRTLGEEELALLSEAVTSGTLTSTKGQFVKTLESRFAERLGVGHVHACSSGTAAVHTAVAALDPEPGDEIELTDETAGTVPGDDAVGAVRMYDDLNRA